MPILKPEIQIVKTPCATFVEKMMQMIDSMASPLFSSHKQTQVRTYNKMSNIQTFLRGVDAHIT